MEGLGFVMAKAHQIGTLMISETKHGGMVLQDSSTVARKENVFTQSEALELADYIKRTFTNKKGETKQLELPVTEKELVQKPAPRVRTRGSAPSGRVRTRTRSA